MSSSSLVRSILKIYSINLIQSFQSTSLLTSPFLATLVWLKYRAAQSQTNSKDELMYPQVYLTKNGIMTLFILQGICDYTLSGLEIVILPIVFNFVIFYPFILKTKSCHTLVSLDAVNNVKFDAKDKNTQAIYFDFTLVILCNSDFTPIRVVPIKNRQRQFEPFTHLFSHFFIFNH